MRLLCGWLIHSGSWEERWWWCPLSIAVQGLSPATPPNPGLALLVVAWLPHTCLLLYVGNCTRRAGEGMWVGMRLSDVFSRRNWNASRSRVRAGSAMLCILQRSCCVLGDFPVCWLDKWSRAGYPGRACGSRWPPLPAHISMKLTTEVPGLKRIKTFFFYLPEVSLSLWTWHLTLRGPWASFSFFPHVPPSSFFLHSTSWRRCFREGPLPCAETHDCRSRSRPSVLGCLSRPGESRRKSFKGVLTFFLSFFLNLLNYFINFFSFCGWLGLCCCTQAWYSCSEWVSLCGGFSLRSKNSRAHPGFRSYGTQP